MDKDNIATIADVKNGLQTFHSVVDMLDEGDKFYFKMGLQMQWTDLKREEFKTILSKLRQSLESLDEKLVVACPIVYGVINEKEKDFTSKVGHAFEAAAKLREPATAEQVAKVEETKPKA